MSGSEVAGELQPAAAQLLRRDCIWENEYLTPGKRRG